jgi:hypothetical protein
MALGDGLDVMDLQPGSFRLKKKHFLHSKQRACSWLLMPGW